MRWVNHKVTTLTMVYALSGSGPMAIIAAASSHLPDLLECNGAVCAHRTLTHWFYIYLLPLFLLWRSLQTNPKLWEYLAFSCLIGCISHLIEDFLSTGGVPIGTTPYGKRVGLGFYVTHEMDELMTTYGMCLSFLFIAYEKGLLNNTAADLFVAQIKGMLCLI